MDLANVRNAIRGGLLARTPGSLVASAKTSTARLDGIGREIRTSSTFNEVKAALAGLQDAASRTLEFFSSCTPNPNTQDVYGQAVREFCSFCTRLGVPLEKIPSPTVAAWVQAMVAEGKSAATVNVKLSGVRHWLDWLARHGVIKGNPASPVRGIKRCVHEGKTPVLERDDAKRLFASLESESDILLLRDKAIFSMMLFGFVRVGAVVKMRVSDFEDGASPCLVLHEKGGRERRIPAHHLVTEALRAYLAATRLLEQGAGKAPLFQSARALSIIQ